MKKIREKYFASSNYRNCRERQTVDRSYRFVCGMIRENMISFHWHSGYCWSIVAYRHYHHRRPHNHRCCYTSFRPIYQVKNQRVSTSVKPPNNKLFTNALMTMGEDKRTDRRTNTRSEKEMNKKQNYRFLCVDGAVTVHSTLIKTKRTDFFRLLFSLFRFLEKLLLL